MKTVPMYTTQTSWISMYSKKNHPITISNSMVLTLGLHSKITKYRWKRNFLLLLLKTRLLLSKRSKSLPNISTHNFYSHEKISFHSAPTREHHICIRLRLSMVSSIPQPSQHIRSYYEATPMTICHRGLLHREYYHRV